VKISKLHEEFIEKARRPMNLGQLPVVPKASDVPVIATNKWTKSEKSLKKTYSFRLQEQRNEFVSQLLDYEVEVGHHADIFITEGGVAIKLQTKDLDQVTELDKEYSKMADELYKDIVYSSGHDRSKF